MFAYAFSIATFSTTRGEEFEQNKYVGHDPTIMRLSTSKDGDLSSYFGKIEGSQDGIKGSSLIKILIDNHEEVGKREKVKGQLPSEHFVRFCRTFEKITKNLGYHLNLKTADLPDLIYTTIGVDNNITIICLHLYVPILIPDPETQQEFFEPTKISFTLTHHSWTTERNTVDTRREYQLDIGSSSDINSPK